MAKKYNFGQTPSFVGISSNRIKPTVPSQPDRISFNFKRLCTLAEKFNYKVCETKYFHVLIDRLREISKMNKQDMIHKNRRALRCHQIKFDDRNVTEDGFGSVGEDICEDAWQFQLTSNEHGRVHGYFVGNVFYVVWLDPQHELYK